MYQSTVSKAAPQVPSHLPVRSRVLRIWFDITDDAGLTKRYCIVPLKLEDANLVSAYKVTPFKAGGSLPDRSYTCSLDVAGHADCSCPGWAHHGHCKHLACLEAAGMFNAAALLAVRGISLELQQRLEILRTSGPAGDVPRTRDGKIANPWGC